MTAAATWYRLHFPHLVEPEQVTALLRALHGLGSRDRLHVVSFQAVGQAGRVEHFLGLPAGRDTFGLAQATATVPGLVLQPVDRPPLAQPQAAWRLWASSSRRPLRTEEPARLSQALLTALASAGRGETIVLQWLLGPVRRPAVVPTKHPPLLS